MKNLKNGIAFLLSMVLVLSVISPLAIQAEESSNNYMSINEYRENKEISEYEAPNAPDGYVFAGWYTDSEYTNPLGKDVKTGYAYAKFVDAKVHSVKLQITAGTELTSEETALRMLTAVDTLKYAKVGFNIVFGSGNTSHMSNTVYEEILAYTKDGQTPFTAEEAFETAEAKYFMTYQITGVPDDYFKTPISVKAVWTTLDGTVVEDAGRDFTIYDIIDKESVYGKGVIIDAAGPSITRVEKVITEGENAGKTYTALASTGSANVNMSIVVTNERGLKANTTYHVTVDVATDGPFPAFIGPSNCFLIGTPGGTIEFDITTDGNGGFAQVFNGSYLQNATYVDFTGITFKEIKGSVYGAGVTISADGSAASRVEKEITEGENAGETYTGLAATGSGNVNFAIVVTNERGLKANTDYHVTVDVATDGPFPAFIGPSDCFIIATPGGTIEFDITTGENGEFTQVYNGAYLQNATYVDFTGITFKEIKGSVYGKGVTISADGSAASRVEKEITEGENAGETYTALAATGSGNVNFAIVVTNEQGLKANTDYHVTVDVATDGPFPAFIGPSDCFIIAAPGGTIEFDITTDGNGGFTQVFNGAYLQNATYVDFTGITFKEIKGSVYGKGVTILADGTQSTRVEKEIAEGENAGETYTGLAATGSGNVNFAIVVTNERGLKANTDYHVTVDVATDGPFPAFIGPSDCFIIAAPGGTIGFDITTDGNGGFTQVFNGAYLQNATYVDFTGITFTEK